MLSARLLLPGLALVFFVACGESERPGSSLGDSGTPPADSGVGPDLCGPLHPTGLCAAGYQCYGGQCFEDAAFCSATNTAGLCPPNQTCRGGVCESATALCSVANPTGRCDAGTSCRAGQCISDALLCSGTNQEGLCLLTTEACLEGTCVPEANLCSAANPTGLCASGLSCTNGVCATPNPCSPAEPMGFCAGGERCLDGTCIPTGQLCSAANPTGLCATGRTCLDGTCTNDALLCTPALPAGLCPMNETCLEGACTANADLCSATNPTGRCVTGQTCLDSQCVDATLLCSSTRPTGLCASGNSCLEGLCVPTADLCSATEPTGLCPAGEICNNGVCEAPTGCPVCGTQETCLEGRCRPDSTLCSTTNPNGLCATGFDCIAGVCTDAGIGCSQNNQTGACPIGQICNAGVCEAIDDAALCNDNNPCTRDYFDFSRNRCAQEPQVASCSDGNACTSDVCQAGTCQVSPIGGCIEPPTLNPYTTPTNVGVLSLGGTKPAGASVEINGLEAVPQSPDTTWTVALNLVPGENVYVVRSVDQGQGSATIEARIVYDITPPNTSLSPAGGTFLNGVTVRLASDEPATVYFTTDGSTPTEDSESFESVKDIRVFDDTTLRLRARDRAGNWQTNVVDASYEITGHGNGWRPAPLLSEALIHTAATQVGNRVILVGGSDGLAPQAGAFAYDLGTATWTALASMSGGRAQLAIVASGNQLYAIGGENNGTPLGRVERLDLSNAQAIWENLAPMPSTRFGISAVVVGNSVHVLGGKTNGGVVLPNHEVLNLTNGTWTNQVAQLPRPRYAFNAVVEGNRIFVAGGEDAQGNPISEVDIYDVGANTWSLGAALPTPRSFAAGGKLVNAGVVNGGHRGLVIAGGRVAGGAATAKVEEYIIEDDTWRERTPMPAARHSGSGLIVVDTDEVDTQRAALWVLGGQTSAGPVDSSVQFTFSQDYVRRLAELPTARFMQAAATLNGRVYLFGGRNFSEELTAWEFDPETEVYRVLPPLNTHQNGLVAAAVGDLVYAIGGADSFGNSVATVRAYDPILNQWIPRTPMQVARRDAAVAVQGTEIWVIGGYNGGALQTVEVYDTVTNTWSSAPVLPNARTGASAFTYNGLVRVVGGLNDQGNPHNTLLTYNGNNWLSRTSSRFTFSHGAAFVVRDQLSLVAGRRADQPTEVIESEPVGGGGNLTPISPDSALLSPLDRFAHTTLHGKMYLFGGNATQAIGPSGVALVQKIEGRCFNGIADGREAPVDSNGGCGRRGYEHSTGLGTLFYNESPVDTSSYQRAVDACNRHYNVTNCGRACGGTYTTVTPGATCVCNSPEYRWHFGNNSPYGGGVGAPGQVTTGGSCPGSVAGNWY